MSTQTLLTYSDALDHLQHFAAHLSLGVSQIQARRIIQAAYHEVLAAHEWPYFVSPGRIQLKAAESDGTLSYDHATLTATLTDATWPSWALGATVYVNDVLCEIVSVTDTTNVVFSSEMNPGADLTDEEFVVFRRWYALDPDFLSLVQPVSADLTAAEVRTMAELYELHVWQHTTGTIRYYAIGPSLLEPGVLALYPWPAADVDLSLDFLWRRRSRTLRYSGRESGDRAGTIATTAGSATVTGTSTAFVAGHAGAILRISSTASVPTGLVGDNPYLEEHKILSVNTVAQTLTLQEAASTTDTDARYLITDPVDLAPTCHQAFLHCVEKHIAIAGSQSVKNLRLHEETYRAALEQAKALSHRSTERRFVGHRPAAPPRLADLGTISIEDW